MDAPQDGTLTFPKYFIFLAHQAWSLTEKPTGILRKSQNISKMTDLLKEQGRRLCGHTLVKHLAAPREMEKAMAPHSSTLAWKIPWAEEPGRLQSMGLLRVGHDWATSLSLFTFIHWRRKWQPTPVFLPGESQGRRCLVGCRLWGHTQTDTTEAT